MKILCTNVHASIMKCTNLIFIAAKQPDYYKYILLHDWEGDMGFEAGSLGPSMVRDNSEAEK